MYLAYAHVWRVSIKEINIVQLNGLENSQGASYNFINAKFMSLFSLYFILNCERKAYPRLTAPQQWTIKHQHPK